MTHIDVIVTSQIVSLLNRSELTTVISTTHSSIFALLS